MSAIKRKQFLVILLLVTVVLVWWVQVYDPMSSELQDLKNDIETLRDKIGRQSEKLNRLGEQIQEEGNIDRRLSELSKKLVSGKRIEDIHAATQTLFQQVLEKNGVTIKTYKELPPDKYRDQTLARIELNFDSTIQALSGILEQVDAFTQLIRIEKLTISYRRAKETDLSVTIQIAALMIGAG